MKRRFATGSGATSDASRLDLDVSGLGCIRFSLDKCIFDFLLLGVS